MVLTAWVQDTGLRCRVSGSRLRELGAQDGCSTLPRLKRADVGAFVIRIRYENQPGTIAAVWLNAKMLSVAEQNEANWCR